MMSYRLVADGSTIYFADSDHAVDLLRQKGNVVIRRAGEDQSEFGDDRASWGGVRVAQPHDAGPDQMT